MSPFAPASIQVEGELRYGTALAVPSLLDTPAVSGWTVVVLASEDPERLSRLLSALRSHSPAGTQVVIVANDPSDAQAEALGPEAPNRSPIREAAPEVLRTSTRLGYATALNLGLRRCAGELVLLAAALADPAVAVAGGFGLAAAEPGPLRPNALRRTEVGPSPGAVGVAADTTALEGAWLAFRRADYLELGPLDEHFVTPAWLDVWWTLRLRAGAEPEGAEYVEPDPGAGGGNGEPGAAPAAGGPDAPGEIDLPAPRRAVRLQLPLEREVVAWPPDRSRLNRRNMYRVLDRFGWRDDLA